VDNVRRAVPDAAADGLAEPAVDVTAERRTVEEEEIDLYAGVA
jgi:hypothetical protein